MTPPTPEAQAENSGGQRPNRPRTRAGKVLTAALVAAAAAAAALGARAAIAEPDTVRDSAPESHTKTREAVDAAVRSGVPGAVIEVRDRQGSWRHAAGVGDVRTGRERSPHDHYRIGSVTKTFVATVLLQLEAEGRLNLDDTVEKWLPGVVRGNGHDGQRVTLRQLLRNTSGIFSYNTDEEFARKTAGTGFFEHRYDTWTPRQLVDVAMRHKPRFRPGKGFDYSNTNYILAGMVVDRVTGRPYGTEIERRILHRLGLRNTSVPGTDPRLPQPSSRAYAKFSKGAKPRDVTELNPSSAGAAGEMISDGADVTRFYRSLLRGELLPRQQMKEMTSTVPIDPRNPEAGGYGLGLVRFRMPCGKAIWGDGPRITGSLGKAFATRDGSRVVALNYNADWPGAPEESGVPILAAEFCR
ncbi:serine hydrolase domain-containing protein [Streptomyces sp. NPDC051776]|uniref:serine hydrolase domain-containing protein n=1 Tax=Streptomyces sp. NPDC051776 TaxID=3155414 RepID=UPI0034339EF5